MTINLSHRKNRGAVQLHQVSHTSLLLLCLSLLLSLTGCAGHSQTQRPSTLSAPLDQHPSPVVNTALSQLNRPYRYGGDSPRGFDCSGLVYYAHLSNGIPIPRTTRDQHRRADPVSLRELAPGDLLFFRETSRKPSHVGLYVGDGRFIHASTSEQAVTLSQLSNPYWQKHLLGAGRYKP